MTRRFALPCLAAAVAMTVACSGTPETPLSPSAAPGVSLGVNPDGSTLKIDAPILNSPGNSEVIETRRPTFVLTNATSPYLSTTIAGITYRLQLLAGDSTLLDERTVDQGDGTTSYEADVDLDYATDFGWRARAEIDGAHGPWSPIMFFRTPDSPLPGGTPSGTVGAPRTIGLDEAVAIIRLVYSERGVDIGRNSTRASRNGALEMAVAVLHYGHWRYNAAGPDPLWCIKDGGPGRPQSDDVIVRCDSRDAWDLVLGIGGSSPIWHPDYIGRLPGGQNVYAPNPGALPPG